MVIEYNEKPYDGITRWASYPIRVWVDASFYPEDLRDAVDMWNSAIGDTGFRIEVASDEQTANIRLRTGPRPADVPDGCGSEGPRRISNNVISEGGGTYYFDEERCKGDGHHRIGLAHGIGHILGLKGHTPGGSDLMGSPQSTWAMSDNLRETMRFIYSSPPGSRVRT